MLVFKRVEICNIEMRNENTDIKNQRISYFFLKKKTFDMLFLQRVLMILFSVTIFQLLNTPKTTHHAMINMCSIMIHNEAI